MAAPKSKKQVTDDSTINGSDKAALLLNALGTETTSKVMNHLKDNDIRRLVSQMAKTKKASVTLVKQIMHEFYRLLSEESVVLFGDDSSKDSLVKILGEERAKLIFGSMNTAHAQQRSLEALEMVDIRTLSNFLVSEHPQTIALIVAHLPAEKKSEVLKRLPETLQGEVILRLANLDYISPDLLQHVDEILKTELATMGTFEATQLGGVDALAEMFNLMDKNSEQSVMSRVEEKDPLLAEEIRKLMFVFEDLVKVEDKGIAVILREVNNDVLLKALKTAPENVKEKVFRNMSKRAAEMIRADIDTSGPMRVSDVEGAQQQMVGIARRLEGEGKIFIERGGEGDGYV